MTTELRLADGAVNPYLLPAVLIAAGLDGIDRQLDPGDRSENNSYQEKPSPDTKFLPSNLLDALRCLESNSVLTKYLGKSFVKSYSKLKYQQWHQYNSQITKWEIDNTLDC